MAHRDLIVVGASAGGVEALRTFVANLPENLPAAVVIVLHIAARSPSALAAILTRVGKYRVTEAVDGDVITDGRIYTAPSDHHLSIRERRLRLTSGPRVNLHRPAIDPLFFSAARWFGTRAVGIVLSGTLDDGSAGLRAITTRGGTGIVQDPEEALYSSMPVRALQASQKCEILTVSKMGERLQRLTAEALPREVALPHRADTVDAQK